MFAVWFSSPGKVPGPAEALALCTGKLTVNAGKSMREILCLTAPAAFGGISLSVEYFTPETCGQPLS